MDWIIIIIIINREKSNIEIYFVAPTYYIHSERMYNTHTKLITIN